MPLYRQQDAGVPKDQVQQRDPNYYHLYSSTSREQRTLSLPFQARYDQEALACASTVDASSISHEHTTNASYSQMGSETGLRPRQNKQDVADDAGSVYSYNSTRDVSNFVKELHGRIFNNLNESYLLPSDQPEWGRLDKQGSALAIAFDGLYPCADIVEAVLQPVEGKTMRILDLGCGTGAWAMQMAVKFPHASVLGVDVAPTPIDQSSFPPNLSLEIDDITLGLSHFAGQFDLVHMRCVAAGLTDYHKTMEEVQLCVKPGGLVLIVDGEISLPAEDRTKMVPFIRLPGDGGPEVTSVSEHGSWFRRLIWEACEACEVAGADLARSYLFNDLGLWDSPLCDPETCRSGGVDLPIGPWARSDDIGETQLLQYVGVLMRQNILNLNRAYHAILLKHGMDQATLDDWSKHTEEQLHTLEPKTWVRFRFYLGRRRAGEGLPAPPLPALPPVDPDTLARHAARPKYPAYDLYNTREENLARMKLRHEAYGVFPRSVLRRAWAKKLAQEQAQARGSH